jgi:DNA-binding NarL/FixJ family response regulator
MQSDPSVIQSMSKPISKREEEIILSLLEGCTNQEIAASLGICLKTVEEHLTRIYKKIGVKTRTQAVLWWVLQSKGIPSLTQKGIRRK